MKCALNENCDHEERIGRMCVELKQKPTRKEIYIIIAICFVTILVWLGLNWNEVKAIGEEKASAEKVDAFEKCVTESLHRQEVVATEMATAVKGFIESVNKASAEAKAQRDRNAAAIRENERRLDRLHD